MPKVKNSNETFWVIFKQCEGAGVQSRLFHTKTITQSQWSKMLTLQYKDRMILYPNHCFFQCICKHFPSNHPCIRDQHDRNRLNSARSVIPISYSFWNVDLQGCPWCWKPNKSRTPFDSWFPWRILWKIRIVI